MTATLTSAVAQSDVRLVSTKKGDRLVGEFRTIEGQDVTLWKMPDDEVFAAIRRNQSVKLVKDSRGWNLIAPSTVEESPVEAPQVPSDSLAPDTKRAIAAYVEQLGDLYAFCHRTASSKLPDADPVVGSAADSLFRAACAKFNP